MRQSGYVVSRSRIPWLTRWQVSLLATRVAGAADSFDVAGSLACPALRVLESAVGVEVRTSTSVARAVNRSLRFRLPECGRFLTFHLVSRGNGCGRVILFRLSDNPRAFHGRLCHQSLLLGHAKSQLFLCEQSALQVLIAKSADETVPEHFFQVGEIAVLGQASEL
ncbi:unnamed protein product [Ixodes hexagonus]